MNPAARARALAKLGSLTFADADVATMRADVGGGVCFVCMGTPNAAPANAAPAISAPLVAGAGVPLTAVPAYHSRPGSRNVAYLDFTGHTISGTAWNRGAKASIPAVAFDLDGDRSTFSDPELTAIRRVWERVAEDFRPFDIDFTTEEPSTWTATTGRVLITANTDAVGDAMPYANAGGVAYVNVFGLIDYPTYSPALVYANNLGNNENSIAEACSHEFGHNLGLSHDGTTTGQGYYSGHGSGPTSWAPIMGASYYSNVTQWSKGEYPNANNPEDDVAIIAGKLAVRPDDHGDTSASAAAITVASGGAFSASGVIATAADSDVFAVSVGAGTISISATPFRSEVGLAGGNLDILLRLVNGAGTILMESNPGGRTDASLTATVPTGTYYVQVHGVGNGDLASGYSDYASLGRYTISGTASASTSDTTPPGTISDVAISGATTSGLTLHWTAPGDDGMSGSAASYDLRYATAPITTVNWSSAAQAAGEPAPSPAGSAESWSLTGLSAGTTYWVAVIAIDDAGNAGALSNVASAATVAASDTTAPATISDLAVSAATTSSLALRWTAPGDDGAAGTAARYDLRYAPAPITTANWSSAAQAAGEPAPAAGGSAQSWTLGGLTPETAYWVAVVAIDEVGNTGALSNVVSASTASSVTTGIRINFQPSVAAAVAGWNIDSGLAFGVRADGLSYGWTTGLAAKYLIDRNSTLSPDQLHDTFAMMQHRSGKSIVGSTWEIALPNGQYTVRVVCGDSSSSSAFYAVNAEGSAIIRGTQSSAQRWVENTVTVTVNDGRLTLTNAADATRNVLNFISIDAVSMAPTGKG